MIKYYRLNDNNEVEECTINEWINFNTSGKKIIKQDDLGDKLVSTVMLGIDHRYSFHGDSLPLLFETMVFPNANMIERYCERYCTYQEALAGHNEIVEKLKAGISLHENND